MKFENTYVYNFEGAFRGLRNPLESWKKSDSAFGIDYLDSYCEKDWETAAMYIDANEKYDYEKEYDEYYEAQEKYANWLDKNGILKNQNDCIEYAFIGPKDLDLAHRMIKAGSSDRKFLRQIGVSVDITAPLYWWKQMDQYKIGTVTNSTSTMHKLASTPITIDCFENDDYDPNLILEEEKEIQRMTTFEDEPILWEVNSIISFLESLRKKYNKTKDKRYWKELIRWLPEGWLQTRTWTANYENLRNIYFQRQRHKLSEWRKFCEWIESLPYATDLIIYTGK